MERCSDQELASLSYIIHLHHLPKTVVKEVEDRDRKLNEAITGIYPNYHEFLPNLLAKFEEKFGIRIPDRKESCWTFLLLTSLKYQTMLFKPGKCTECVRQTIELTLQEINTIDPSTMQLLRVLELFLKKRNDVLTSELTWLTLQKMTALAHSPLTGFKALAHSISRLALKNIDPVLRNTLCDFTNPPKCLDLNDFLDLFKTNELLELTPQINDRILDLFSTNTDSRNGGFYYTHILKLHSFDDFVRDIWPSFAPHLQDLGDGEFYHSFLKYWIPATVKEYKNAFCAFIQGTNTDIRLKAQTILELRKRGLYKVEYDSDALIFLKHPRTTLISLQVYCTFSKKRQLPDSVSADAVKYFLLMYSEPELYREELKYLAQFFSQIFIASHLASSTEPIPFLDWLFNFCTIKINSDFFELGSQLLKLVFDILTQPLTYLKTSYKLEQSHDFTPPLFLTSYFKSKLHEPLLKRKIHETLTKIVYTPHLTQLVVSYFLPVQLHLNIFDIYRHLIASVCLQSSEIIRCYSQILAVTQLELSRFYTEFYDCLGRNELFPCTLILDIILVHNADDDLSHLLLISLRYLRQLFTHLHKPTNPKDVKILEAFISNVLEGLSRVKCLVNLDKREVLDDLIIIIEKSNLKRPVELCVTTLEKICTFMENTSQDKQLKLKCLDAALRSLHCSKDSGKIRRNPESRLVIHALCKADKDTKHCLDWCLRFIIEALSTPSTTDLALAASLHSLEVLISDNCLHQATLPYMPQVIDVCLALFENTNWRVRNADIQLLKALIERFLGVLLYENQRPKTVVDLFTLFPDLISKFYAILSRSQFPNSAIVILIFFAESHIHDCSDEKLNAFLPIFQGIILDNPKNFGYLAVRAFVALCPIARFSTVKADLLHLIQSKVTAKVVLGNLIQLLFDLCEKFQVEPDFLLGYLRSKNESFYDLLGFKIRTPGQILDSLNSKTGFMRRIWLNNNIPIVIKDTPDHELGQVLTVVLNTKIPSFVHLRILGILRTRNLDPEVTSVLLAQLLHLTDLWLIKAYSKTILLLLFDQISTQDLSADLISKIRDDFRTTAIYKIFVYVLILAKFKNPSDYEGFKCCLKRLEGVTTEEELQDLALILPHLYPVLRRFERLQFFKLVFRILLNESCSSFLWGFVTKLTGRQSFGTFLAFANLYSFTQLLELLTCKTLVAKLLLDLLKYTAVLPNDLEASDTYFSIQNHYSVSKQDLQRIQVIRQKSSDSAEMIYNKRKRFLPIPDSGAEDDEENLIYEMVWTDQDLMLENHYFDKMVVSQTQIEEALEKITSQLIGSYRWVFSLEEISNIEWDVTFNLYTKNNPIVPQVLPNKYPVLLKYSHFNPAKKTVFVVHGFTDHKDRVVIVLLRLALCRTDVNVIVVNWKDLASQIYTSAVLHVVPVGEHLGKFLKHLQSWDYDLENVHLIGHSLGAHICGIAGRYVHGSAGRITGLDPAGPLFEFIEERTLEEMLDKTDARFVDIIHTNGDEFGVMKLYGHADFYPNEGTSPQPGCAIPIYSTTCSHVRSVEFFIESIETPKGFEARHCDSESPDCLLEAPVHMGYFLSPSAQGVYHLTTNAEAPFSKQ